MAIDTAIGGTSPARPGLPGVIIAATIGNVLEWFDFLVYGFFAVTIAEVFFPASNSTVSLRTVCATNPTRTACASSSSSSAAR